MTLSANKMDVDSGTGTSVKPNTTVLGQSCDKEKAVECNSGIGPKSTSSRVARRFHFEEWWVDKESCADIVSTSFTGLNNLHGMHGLVVGLNRCTSNLAQWNIVNRKKLLRDLGLKHDELHRVSSDIKQGSWKVIRKWKVNWIRYWPKKKLIGGSDQENYG
ncbi:hypothetical protein LWI28_008942 [Acer negundo]|uniref:Uncharacterized protein n=1 Tax=Acer negundo TaxID=4023 RepID=A0AAD5J8W3_ACENE|nr:hypothetical protein LWI28_008942 [Acer negundo]